MGSDNLFSFGARHLIGKIYRGGRRVISNENSVAVDVYSAVADLTRRALIGLLADVDELPPHKITDSVKIAKWIWDNDFKPEVNHKFQFHAEQNLLLKIHNLFKLNENPFLKYVKDAPSNFRQILVELDASS